MGLSDDRVSAVVHPVPYSTNDRRRRFLCRRPAAGHGGRVGVALLGAAYGATLAAGLWSLQSPEEPVGDPFFSALEILIILLAPLMVVLMVAVHAWTSPQLKTYSLAALVFMSLLAGITCSVHLGSANRDALRPEREPQDHHGRRQGYQGYRPS